MRGHIAVRVSRSFSALFLRRYLDSLAVRSHIDAEPLPKRSLVRHQEARFLLDDVLDVVRQPAVRKRDTGPRSTIRISACSSSLRRRARTRRSAATPPTMMTFIAAPFLLLPTVSDQRPSGLTPRMCVDSRRPVRGHARPLSCSAGTPSPSRTPRSRRRSPSALGRGSSLGRARTSAQRSTAAAVLALQRISPGPGPH